MFESDINVHSFLIPQITHGDCL